MVYRPAGVLFGQPGPRFLTDPLSQRPSSPSQTAHAASHPGRPNEGAGMDLGVGMRATSCILSAS